MRCASCGPADRTDRPHVLLKQEPIACPGCGARVEARVVLRAGGAFRLRHCPRCGPGEDLLSSDAGGYLEAFLRPGRAGEATSRPFKRTTSTCPSCLALVDADVLLRDGRVYFAKRCERCGPSEALVSEDARYYVEAYTYARAGSAPLRLDGAVARGCPEDCGLCPDHEQHTCIPIVEVTDHCNLECPTCLVDNAGAHHLAPEAFARMIDRLVEREGKIEALAISGGEPTSHPRLLELVDAASRPEIGRVMVLTNGVRLGRDRALAEGLAERGAYVGLQFDGFTPEAHRALRGRDLTAEKEAALEVLEALRIPTQLIFVAARGVNEDQIGKVVELFLSKEHFISLNFQPLALSGRGGGTFAADPMDRITVPGVLAAVERQTAGAIRASDFAPLPCPSPHCVALLYLLRLQDGSWVPFPRFADLRRHGGLLRNSAALPALPEMERVLQDVVYSLFARQDEVPGGSRILAALKGAIGAMFPERPLPFREAVRRGERHAKSIFVHHFMDRHDFDLERLRKCCNHYPQTDGRLMPACGFNLFHRGAARGRGTPRAPFGAGPWGAEG
jgi:uncharacterized radical SAM superfamily Fe-S cluster-containing enzyme